VSLFLAVNARRAGPPCRPRTFLALADAHAQVASPWATCCKSCCKTVDTDGLAGANLGQGVTWSELEFRFLALAGTRWNRRQAVFKTVARPASWSRVGSTPMHLRHNLNSESTTTASCLVTC